MAQQPQVRKDLDENKVHDYVSDHSNIGLTESDEDDLNPKQDTLCF